MALDKFRDPADPIWEQRVNQLEEGTGIGEVTTAKIASEAVTGAKTAAAVLGRRILLSGQGIFAAAEGTGTYFFNTGGGKLEKATTLAVEYATTTSPFFQIKTTEWEVAGRTPKIAVRLDAFANAKQSGAGFVAGLYQVEKIEGATGKVKVTYKAVLAGSTATINAPTESTGKTAVSTSVALPAEAYYALGVEVTTEALKAESMVMVNADLVLIYS